MAKKRSVSKENLKKAWCPSEAEEQRALIQWARLREGLYPELRLLYHVPNERRDPAERVQQARMGTRPGVPDIVLPVARGGFHGLYIELKRLDGGKRSEAQTEYINQLRQQGYCAEFRNGWMAAAELILKYLETPK